MQKISKINWFKIFITFIGIVAIIFFALRIENENKYKAELRKELVILKNSIKQNSSQPESEKNKKQEEFFEISKVLAKIEKQKEIDRMLLEELESDSYTFEEPFVIVDPYNESPLTAVILFTTSEPMNISIEIEGESVIDTFSYTFEGYNTKHILPVFTLYAEKENKIRMYGKGKNNKTKEVSISIETDRLSDEIANRNVITNLFDEKEYQHGLNFFQGSCALSAIDSSGKWRWYLNGYDGLTAGIANYTKNGKGLFIRIGSYLHGDAFVLQVNYLGKILGVYYTQHGAHHEMLLTKSNTLVVGANSEKETIEDAISEIDLSTGKEINSLNYKKILDRTRQVDSYYSTKDWLHLNAITSLDNDLLISSRHQSLVMKHDWQGNIKWMLSNPKGYSKIYKDYLLKPIGDNFEFQYNQHAPIELPDYDSNSDTVDIMLFDNGNARFEVEGVHDEKNALITPLYSRVVHYRINEKDMTVEQIWEYGSERPELYSLWQGSGFLLNNGNILSTFDRHPAAETGYFKDYSSVIVELTPEKEEVWEAVLSTNKINTAFSVYRSERLDIYSNGNSVNLMNLGKEANVFIPQNILK